MRWSASRSRRCCSGSRTAISAGGAFSPRARSARCSPSFTSRAALYGSRSSSMCWWTSTACCCGRGSGVASPILILQPPAGLENPRDQREAQDEEARDRGEADADAHSALVEEATAEPAAQIHQRVERKKTRLQSSTQRTNRLPP